MYFQKSTLWQFGIATKLNKSVSVTNIWIENLSEQNISALFGYNLPIEPLKQILGSDL